MRPHLHLAAAAALVSCGLPEHATPVWEVTVPDAETARNLVARGGNFCFLITTERDTLAVGLQCHGPDGALRWERPINEERARVNIDAAGDVLLAAGSTGDPWWVEKHDGSTGESRWRYTFQFDAFLPEARLRDLITTDGDQVVFHLEDGFSIADDQDPPGERFFGRRFLVGLSSATGTRLWRERLDDERFARSAAVGDEVIVTYGDRIERRDRSGAVVSSRPLTASLFAVRSFTSADARELADVFGGDDGRLYGIPASPALVRAATPDGDVVFNVVPGGDREIPAVELAVGPGGLVLGGRFFGDLELGDTTLKHDERGAPSSPFDPSGTGRALPFIAVTDRDGNPRWSATLLQPEFLSWMIGVALLSADRALVLHQREGQVWVSAFDVP